VASQVSRRPLSGHCEAGSFARAGRKAEGLCSAGSRLHDQDWPLRLARLQEEEEGVVQIEAGSLNEIYCCEIDQIFALEI